LRCEKLYRAISTQDNGFINVRTPKGCKLFPMTFMGNPENNETQNLVAEYENELNPFWNIYKKDDPLILFLKCICN